MGYKLELSVAANTAKADANEDKVTVFAGVLKSVFVHLPRGSARKLKFRLLVGGHQVFPKNVGKWFDGDFVNQTFEIWYNMEAGDNTLILEAYNTSTLFSRYVSIDATVLPRWVAYPQMAFEKLRKALEYFLVGGEK